MPRCPAALRVTMMAINIAAIAIAMSACGRGSAGLGESGSSETPEEEPFAVTIDVSLALDAAYEGEVVDLVGQAPSIQLPHCSLVGRTGDIFRVNTEAPDPDVFGIALVRYEDGAYFSGGGDGMLASAYETPEQIGDALPVHAAFDPEVELYRVTPYEATLIQVTAGAPAQLSGDTIAVSYPVDVNGESYTVTETHTIAVEAPVAVDVQPLFGCD